MLFDLQSPRRRNFIRVVYAMLALLLGGGLILFGIGGGGNGGILDAIGLTDSSGGGSGGNPFEDQINQAQERLAANPQDQQALITLVNLHIQAGNQKVQVDEASGQTFPTADSAEEYSKAADSWDAYLKTNPAKPNAGAALQMANGFFALAQLSDTSGEAQSNLEEAAKAQQFAVDANPSFGSYASLAQYQYLAGETAAGDASIQKAKELNPSQANTLDQFVAQIRKVADNFQKQRADEAKAAKQQGQAGGTGGTGANPFQNPLESSGSLGGQ